MQVDPVGHARPQPLQLFGSEVVSTQPAGQHSPVPDPRWHGSPEVWGEQVATAHTLPPQVSTPEQSVPQSPQCDESVDVSTQALWQHR